MLLAQAAQIGQGVAEHPGSTNFIVSLCYWGGLMPYRTPIVLHAFFGPKGRPDFPLKSLSGHLGGMAQVALRGFGTPAQRGGRRSGGIQLALQLLLRHGTGGNDGMMMMDDG